MVENQYPDFLEHLMNIIATAPGMHINAVVDISHWNESVDFKLAKEDGILG